MQKYIPFCYNNELFTTLRCYFAKFEENKMANSLFFVPLCGRNETNVAAVSFACGGLERKERKLGQFEGQCLRGKSKALSKALLQKKQNSNNALTIEQEGGKASL